MNINVLGISALYHDSAAVLVQNGEIVAAAQEERFSRKKHDPRFPFEAINYCLEEAFMDPSELSAVVYYDNPVLTFDRAFKSLLSVSPLPRDKSAKALASLLGLKFRIRDMVTQSLGEDVKLLISEHHLSHAASAFYPSPFEESAILTLDGVGEWTTTSLGVGSGDKVELLHEIRYPHSLGLLYSAFTYFCGFKVNSGEYKLMGLAPYGEPKYADRIRDHLIDIKPDGSFRLNMDYFGYLGSDYMTNERFAALFDGPARAPDSRINHREMDLAASIQQVTEEVIMALATTAGRLTGKCHLVMAGGVALNCVANGKLLRSGMFDGLWIQPASGDAGGALGAALLASHSYFGVPRPMPTDGRDQQKGSYLGPSFSNDEVTAFLDRHEYPHVKIEDRDARAQTIAVALAEGKVVGYMAGRMEYGPRALGARSILGDPRNASTQSVMNLKIKYRESFRPFAPSVLEERVGEYFELEGESPYMLLVAPVHVGRRIVPEPQAQLEDLTQIINQPRSDIPAVTHVDHSARIQTVTPEQKPDYYEVIKAFEELTGYGLVVNTSFNVRGEPIVCTPADAYRCFMRTDMDMLVLEDSVLRKTEQPVFENNQDWRQEYELD